MQPRSAPLLLLLLRSMIVLAGIKKGPPYFTQKQRMTGSFIAWPAWHSIKLKCKANGPPPLTFQWLKNGQPLTYRRLQPSLRTNLWYLRLRDLVPTDTGDYTCVVSNPYGQVNHTYTLQVVVKARTKPILKCGYPKNTTAEVGGNATLACIVTMSGTIPDFRWIRWDKIPKDYPSKLNLDTGDYTLIDPVHYRTMSPDRDPVMGSGVELKLTNLAEWEFGLYTCVVSNHLGRDFRSAYLTRRAKQMARRPTIGLTSSPAPSSTQSSMKDSMTTKHHAATAKLRDEPEEPSEPRIPLSIFVGVLSAWASLTAALLIWCYFRTRKNKQDKQESWL